MTSAINIGISDDPGKSIVVPYMFDEPIFFLAERAARMLNETSEDYHWRELYLNGFHLETYHILGDGLTYHSARRGTMAIFIETPQGTSLSLSCDPLGTIAILKMIVFKREGIHPRQQRLEYQGKTVADDRTLQSYGITHSSTITRKPCMRGGAKTTNGIKFADVSYVEGIETMGLVENPEPGLVVRPGTNIEVKCECTPEYRVVCPIGFDTIELSQETFTCPICDKTGRVPATVGFRPCKCRFYGLKSTGEQYTAKWTSVAGDDDYHLFDPTKQTGWTRLVIESARLDAKDACLA
ncbi:hypothetical protein BGX33_002510 [Mortierella sp. NVP41]|nr:hypothetical protein BGX33_002510 [Mortierella sp. NVP41]